MMSVCCFRSRLLLAAALLYSGAFGSARADVLLDEIAAIGSPAVPAPAEYSFTTTAATGLTVTLTDYKTPAAFASLQVAVTLGDTLVGTASVDGTTNQVVATVNLPGAIGTYTVHVIGTPDATQGIGYFDVCVAPQATPTSCTIAEYSASLQVPTPPSSNISSTLNTNFTPTVTGSYTISLTDDAFPAALSSLSATVFLNGTIVVGPFNAGTPVQVNLNANASYQLLIAAFVGNTVPAGLYGVQITDPTNTAIFARTLPVGELASSTIVSNPSAQTLSLSVMDLGYPSSLTGIGAAVTVGATTLAPPLTNSGTANITAPKGNVELWHYAAAGAGLGSYSLSVTDSNATTLYSATEVVNSGSAASATSFAFVAPLPAAGTYGLAVKDFQFPGQLGSLTYTVAQNGVEILPDSSGNFIAPAAGSAIVIVNATAGQTSGIFGVTVATAGANSTTLLDQTQAVGGQFTSRTLHLGTSGDYDVTLTDLAFPQKFNDLAVIVTQNGQSFGKIYGGGAFPIGVTPGSYVVTFVATPGTQSYGLYSLNISSAPPTVTLSANPTSVPAGQSTQVSWASTDSTSCSASGTSAFNGNEPVSETGIAVAIPATATLTLTCIGPGGSTTSTPVTVTATAAVSSSGGGGALDIRWLLMLAVFVAIRLQPALQQRSAWGSFASR